MKRQLLVCTVFVLCFLSVCQAQQEPRTGEQVVEAMFNKYSGKWYKYLTFNQRAVFYKDNAIEREEIWYEAMDIHEGLVIKFNAMNSGSGMLFKADSQFVYTDNVIVSKAKRVHELVVLGFSVYIDQPAVTIAKLKEVGYTFDQIKVETIEGKKQYVVGDEDKAQFWIDANTLLFTKLKKKLKNGSISEIQFKDYRKLKKGWLENEVVFLKDGQVTLHEIYQDVKLPEKLPASFYNKKFSEITW